MKKYFVLIFFAFLLPLIIFTFKVRSFEEQAFTERYKPYVSEKPGLLMEIFENEEYLPPVISRHVIEYVDLTNLTFPAIGKEKISATVKGFLKVPATEVYSLELASDDGSVLFLDGKKVINNGGFHTFESKKTKLLLKQGWHHLEIRYQNRAGAAGLKLAWGTAGKPRQVVGKGDIFLAKEIPFRPTMFPGDLAQRYLFLNQIRTLFFLGALVSLIFFFWGKRIIPLFRSWEMWAVMAVFVLAFVLRAVHYYDHLYLRIQGMMDGGDTHFFITLPLRFVSHGEFIALYCGNLPLMIPLLGTIYKYFHFFPGIHYFSLLMIAMGSVVTTLPWFVLRKSKLAVIGLLAGLFLAVNPTLVSITIPYVSSDPLGFFIFSFVLFFAAKALMEEKTTGYIAVSIWVSLLALSRTAYIPLAPVILFLLILFGKNKKAAFAGTGLFLAVMVAYDLFAATILNRSYFLFYLWHGTNATVVQRGVEHSVNIDGMLKWFFHYSGLYLENIFSHLLPIAVKGNLLRWGIVLMLVLASVALAVKKTRLFLVLIGVTAIYYCEIVSYHFHPRLTYPLFFSAALVLALGLNQLLQYSAVKAKKWFLAAIFFPLLALSCWQGGVEANELTQRRHEKKEYFNWVKQNVSPKSIVMTDMYIDPWEIHEGTGLPVFFEITLNQTYVVHRREIPVDQVMFLSDQSQTDDLQLNKHAYVLDRLSKEGYRFLVLQKELADKFKNFYFKNENGMSINPKHYDIVKIAGYPDDPGRGVWELKRNKTPLHGSSKSFQNNHPKQIDRFLLR